jgi:predicted HTH domain antitoxin
LKRHRQYEEGTAAHEASYDVLIERCPQIIRLMPTVSFDVPAEVLSALRRAPDEFAREMRLAAAMHWYRRGDISQEKAAILAGLDRADFLAACAREKIDVYQVDLDDLQRELERSPSS